MKKDFLQDLLNLYFFQQDAFFLTIEQIGPNIKYYLNHQLTILQFDRN